MDKYEPVKIESKWQKKWEEWGLYQAIDLEKKPKKYLLIEFPYPSGERLHVGHGRSYCCLDAMARLCRMKSFNVLYPIGWDAFGLPAENYAIKTGINPVVTTKENIKSAKAQAKSWGLSFDWSREINTTDPDYYKWTQWIFIQLFKKGLAFKKEVAVNWCPKCKTNLADEEVLTDGTHERCGQKTEKKMQKQWLIKITAYAERLLKDLNRVNYREDIKRQQVNWIGKKQGINIIYPIEASQGLALQEQGEALSITVFTTRPDTNFGATFIVLAPENPLSLKITTKTQLQSVKKYINNALNKSELERISDGRKKTGVFTGRYAINQLTGLKMPIYVADFVLSSVGTGAVVGVPGHDKRDFEFTKEFKLPVIRVVVGKDGDTSDITEIKQVQEEEGKMVNSDFLNGLDIHQATKKITDYLVQKGWGETAFSYHLRDWVFSRQHYWGEPIPMIYCKACADKKVSWWDTTNSDLQGKYQISRPHQGYGGQANIKNQNNSKYSLFSGENENSKFKINDELKEKMVGWFPVDESELPVELPYVEKYQPSGTGESPLAKVTEWVKVACPECGGPAKRETDTMPNWAGSNWYFLGYVIAHSLKSQYKQDRPSYSSSESRAKSRGSREVTLNSSRQARTITGYGVSKNIFEENKDLLKYWLPVDLYNGGMEHTTLHLLYSRFIYKFLYDLGCVPASEPYAQRWSHGVVLGPDGAKMSKSRGNVINPDEIIKIYGADTFRLYEAFMGPFEQMIVWDEKGVKGCYRFLKRVWEITISNIKYQISKIQSKNQKEENLKTSYCSSDPELAKGESRTNQLWRLIYKTTKKVEDDIWHLKFNTAIASLMKLLNAFYSQKDEVTLEMLKHYLLLLAPFAPFISEELWEKLNINKTPLSLRGVPSSSRGDEAISNGIASLSAFTRNDNKYKTFKSIHLQFWPKYNESLLKDEEITIAIQVNGKLRDIIKISPTSSLDKLGTTLGAGKLIDKNKIIEFARNREKIAKYLKEKKTKKVIYVPGRLINFVI